MSRWPDGSAKCGDSCTASRVHRPWPGKWTSAARTWVSYESGVVIPAPVILRFIEVNNADPV